MWDNARETGDAPRVLAVSWPAPPRLKMGTGDAGVTGVRECAAVNKTENVSITNKRLLILLILASFNN